MADEKRIVFGLTPKLPYAIEEAVNRLRINISFLGSDVRKIMVISSEPNEGKSFLALNIWSQMAQAGEPPYAIIVPGDFDYPVERVSIINAYKKFINWAQDMNTDKDWYTYPEEGKVYPSLFK